MTRPHTPHPTPHTPDCTPEETRVWQALKSVNDPELPAVSILDMGIVRHVSVQHNHARVTITPTFSGCPALETIRADIKTTITQLGFTTDVITSLTPAWTSDWISPEGHKKLADAGISPPEPAQTNPLVQLAFTAARCPRCASFDTEVKNTFGATLCKSLHYCHACKEPFEAFKPL